MQKILKMMKFPSERAARPVKFRQFETLEDAITQLGGENILLAFLHTAIIEHDRKQLRYYATVGNRTQLQTYDNYSTFITGDKTNA